MDLAKYRAMFVAEAQEHLREMNSAVVRLEEDPADTDRINGLFRNAHSIKGMAASMGFEELAALSHRLEDLMDRYRQGGVSIEPPAIDLLLEGIDALAHHVQAIADDTEPEIVLEPLIARVESFLEGARSPGQTGAGGAPGGAAASAEGDAAPRAEAGPEVGGAEPQPGSPSPGARPAGAAAGGGGPGPSPSDDRPGGAGGPEATGRADRPAGRAPAARAALLKIDVTVSPDASSARVRAFMAHRKLAELGRVVAAVPSAADLRSGEGHFGGTLTAAVETDRPVDEVRALLAGIPDLASVSIEVAGVAPGEGTAPSVPPGPGAATERPGGADGMPAAGVPDRQAPPGGGSGPSRPDGLAAAASPGAQGAAGAAALGPRAAVRVPRTVKVQTDLLDSFVNLAGELLVVESRLKAVTRDLDAPPVKDALASLGQLVRALHTQIMTVRMMPLSTVTDGLPRVVRDLARREGKEVTFVQDGTELELDRGVLEELPDILTHVLRNAVDHGIEPVRERLDAGKPPRGRIGLRAFRQKDRAVIRIEDDGRGMDPARLKAKAVERGHLTPEQAAALSDAEALYLACLPGLSTARQVTEVSGRGVGMDAVKARIEALGGALRLESQPGQGSRVSLLLPVSVAIVHVLLVGLDREVFAIPVSKVLRTLEVDRRRLVARGRQLLFRHGEAWIPLLSLRKILRLPAGEARGRTLTVAVVPVRQRVVGLVVDRFVGQQEAFVKPLPRPLAAIDGIAGVTILGDGRAIFLLDSENLF